MPDSGSGVGVPISGGVPGSGQGIAQPLPVTWLSLHRYAKIVDINPVHFWGAVGQTIWPMSGNSCNDIWPRYSWQYGAQVSLFELAHAIKDAETAIADFVGYPLAPTFIENERHAYPHFYNKDYQSLGGRTPTGYRSVTADWKKVISPGRRAVTLLETATVAGGSLVYSDEDNDGFNETATITVATIVEPYEVKVYHTGQDGVPEWEIREANSKKTVGANVVLKFDSWLFIDPDRQAIMPTFDGFEAIDITTTANYVTSVDVYREYVDTTNVPAQFNWLCSCGSISCAVCGTTTQTGCVNIRDHEQGFLVPLPGTYSDGWSTGTWSLSRSPEYVSVWYQAGDVSREYTAGRNPDPLSDFWAMQIIYLATARLYKPFCQCGNVTAFAKDLQVDLTRTGEAGGHLFDFTKVANPFGTREGEFRVYKTLALGGGKRRKISTGAVR